MAVYACVLLALVTFLLGVERYQAKEVAGFILNTQEKTEDMQWSEYLTSAQKLHRNGRISVTTGKSDVSPLARDGASQASLWSPVAKGKVTGIPSTPSLVGWNVVSPFLPPAPQYASTLPLPALQNTKEFPDFDRAVYPVSQVPNWGAMRSPTEWDRSFRQMTKQDMVALPRYDLKALTIPMASLTRPITSKTIPIITDKLVYSTRYYGSYDIDAGEFTGVHPGIDIKLAFGTPVGCLAGGRVQTVAKDENMGLYVIVEHRLPDGETFFSLYGHFDTVWVQEGDDIRSGQALGIVGMTGNTTAPHVHLQVDRDDGMRPHLRYWPIGRLSKEEAEKYTMNPMMFIEKYANGAI